METTPSTGLAGSGDYLLQLLAGIAQETLVLLGAQGHLQCKALIQALREINKIVK